MPAPTGATLARISSNNEPNQQYICWQLSGTYTAADFDITQADGLGFTPVHAKVLNLTDRTSTEGWTGSANGLVTVAAGTRTLAAHGITLGARKLTIDVSVAGPITDNDTAIIEAWG